MSTLLESNQGPTVYKTVALPTELRVDEAFKGTTDSPIACHVVSPLYYWGATGGYFQG